LSGRGRMTPQKFAQDYAEVVAEKRHPAIYYDNVSI